MKNEALEDLWRLLNVADIEGKGLAPSVVKDILAKLEDAADNAYDKGYDDGYRYAVAAY